MEKGKRPSRPCAEESANGQPRRAKRPQQAACISEERASGSGPPVTNDGMLRQGNQFQQNRAATGGDLDAGDLPYIRHKLFCAWEMGRSEAKNEARSRTQKMIMAVGGSFLTCARDFWNQWGSAHSREQTSGKGCEVFAHMGERGRI